MRILLVDDEADFAEALRRRLENEQMTVDTARDGPEGLERALSGGYDLILLDLMLPGFDGIEFCRRLRQTSQTPVIMVTARDDDVDKIVGLEVGADDYITKPFNFRELQARIKAVMRRTRPEGGPGDGGRPLVFENLTIDPVRHRVAVDGETVELTAREFDLLWLLATHPRRVFSRDQLLNHIWGADYYGSLRTVDVLIHRLREKIEPDPSSPRWLHTRRGVGYYMAAGGAD